MSLGVPREIVIKKKNKHRFLSLLAKINRSTEKYNSLLKRALTIIIGLLYLQLTDHVNVPWAIDIIIFMQGFPETWKLFQGFLQGKKIEKGWNKRTDKTLECSCTAVFLNWGPWTSRVRELSSFYCFVFSDIWQSSCTATRHAGAKLLLIHDLDTLWVVSVTPRPHLTPGERTPGTHWTGGWVGLRAGLDTEARGKKP
jgi:hypothetical protein